MTQPPGPYHPLHGLHLTANKVPHTRRCVGIGHSQRECSPLYRGEVPTHTGESVKMYLDAAESFLISSKALMIDQTSAVNMDAESGNLMEITVFYEKKL